MKKVISFSLWGTDPAMWRGAAENARLAKLYYPGWECWFHLPLDVVKDYGCSYVKYTLDVLYWLGNTMLQTVEQPAGWPGLFWRYAPIFNPEVGITLVRDCDSRLNPREAAAVCGTNGMNGWIKPAGYDMETLHHMRDHIEHTVVPIMGGMCGFLHWPQMEGLLNDWSNRDHKGADQEFLAEKVWPLLSQDALCHDRWPHGIYWDRDHSTEKPVDGDTVFHYEPEKFFGPHRRLYFPDHETYDEEKLGAHVGARIL